MKYTAHWKSRKILTPALEVFISYLLFITNHRPVFRSPDPPITDQYSFIIPLRHCNPGAIGSGAASVIPAVVAGPPVDPEVFISYCWVNSNLAHEAGHVRNMTFFLQGTIFTIYCYLQDISSCFSKTFNR